VATLSRQEVGLTPNHEEFSMEERYLTEQEVARITSLSLSKLRSDRFKGKGIPYYKIGRSVRYSMRDIVQYLEVHRISHVRGRGCVRE